MRYALAVSFLLAQPAGWKPPAVRILDEGAQQGYASTLNCVGTGISCSVGASVATVTVAGGGGSATPGGVSGNVQINSAGIFGAYTGTTCTYAVKSLDASGAATCTAAPSIPADVSGASYWTRVSESGLSSETALGALGTGIILNTTTTGVPTIYAGTSCTNQFPRSLNASGSATCAGVALTDLTATGTPSATTFLRGDNTWATPAGGGAVAGTDKQVIYNNAGAYAGNANFTFDQATGAVGVGAPTFLTNNPFGVAGNVNGFVQVAIQNKSAGTSASSDFVATADNGTNTANFVDVGINSSTYSDASYTIGGALSGYLFANGGDLTVGTQTAAKVLKLHTGGTLAANLRATITDTALNLASGVGLQANGASGTSTQVLHGAASGTQTWSAVGLTTDVTGTLPIANGGTNSTATATAGGAGYGTGTAHAYTAAGSTGQVLTSNAASAPTWQTPAAAKLCGARLGSALATTGAITCTAAEGFWCKYQVTSYSGGGDIASFRFNADATAANYHARWINFSNAATPVISGVTFTTGGNIQLGPVAITAGRDGLITCSNITASRKVCTIRESEEATAQATVSQVSLGYGEWFNTAAQITSIEMRTNGGSVTMGVGSGFVCYGGTPP